MDTKGFLVVTLLLSFSSARCQLSDVCDGMYLKRSNFSGDFFFGTATSAYQIEGAANKSGKGQSIWDTFTKQHPEKIRDKSSGDAASESYQMYKLDLVALKEMGLNSYRFSIAWSRVLPSGRPEDGVNQEGVDFYNNLINELKDNGIEPFVTLFHWDIPQALEDEYGGFRDNTHTRIVEDFREYADFCFSKFGDRVKNWITFSEPWSYSVGGYAIGSVAPGRCSEWQKLNCTGGDSSTEPYIVAHNIILAHSAAVQLYDDEHKEQDGLIGITHVASWFEPHTNEREDFDAVQRVMDFMLGWFMEPLTFGDYPKTMKYWVKDRLPKFTEQQSEMLVEHSYDFVGLNYYTGYYVMDESYCQFEHQSYTTDAHAFITPLRNGSLIGLKAASDWLYIYPVGLRNLLIYTMIKYEDPPIVITENGVDEKDDDRLMLIEALADKMRIDYHRDHLCYTALAIEEGADVQGYFAWSMLDNFDWCEGYTVRFGMNYVDFKRGMARFPKLSAIWLKTFLQTSLKPNTNSSMMID